MEAKTLVSGQASAHILGSFLQANRMDLGTKSQTEGVMSNTQSTDDSCMTLSSV